MMVTNVCVSVFSLLYRVVMVEWMVVFLRCGISWFGCLID